jgi:hypothetical protein
MEQVMRLRKIGDIFVKSNTQSIQATLAVQERKKKKTLQFKKTLAVRSRGRWKK